MFWTNPWQHCPASGSTCSNCLKQGHWAKACRNPANQQLRRKQINEVISRQCTDEQSSSEEDVLLHGRDSTP